MKPCRGYYASGKGYRTVEIVLCEVVLRPKSGCGPLSIWLWPKAGREVVANESGRGGRTGSWARRISAAEWSNQVGGRRESEGAAEAANRRLGHPVGDREKVRRGK